MVAVLGCQSIDELPKGTQFIYKEEQTRVGVKYMSICIWLYLNTIFEYLYLYFLKF